MFVCVVVAAEFVLCLWSAPIASHATKDLKLSRQIVSKRGYYSEQGREGVLGCEDEVS